MQGDEITRLLMDEYAMKILMAAYNKDVTALDLSRNFEIPIAACYRRINSLESAGLLEMAGEREGRYGKKVKYYRAKLKSATITFLNGKMVAKFTFKSGEEKTIALAKPMPTPGALA